MNGILNQLQRKKKKSNMWIKADSVVSKLNDLLTALCKVRLFFTNIIGLSLLLEIIIYKNVLI